MIEYIVKVLTKKFNIKTDMAIYFYYELLNRRKIEHFINNVEKFKDFESLKKFYLGGNENEL